MTIEQFSEIYRKYQRALYGYAIKLTKGDNYAEDLTQDAWREAWKSRDSFDPVLSVWAWLVRITKRAWWWHLNPHRDRGTPVKLEPMPENYDAPVKGGQHKAASALYVRRAVAKLSDTRRNVVTMYYGGDLDTAEIARIRGTTQQGSSELLRAGLKDLRRLLGSSIDGLAG